jgi:hypothetical protein
MTPKQRILAAICLYLLSICVLTFEVSLSRVLAATTGYHMAFLAVSLTIFGLGGGGFGLYWIRRRGGTWAKSSGPALLAALLLPLSLLGFVLASVFTSVSQHWVPFMLVTLLPFFFAGVVISHLFRQYAQHASFLYAFDLLGAAMGCLVVVLLLHGLGGGIRAILAAALLACGPMLAFAVLTEARLSYLLAGAGTAVLSLALLCVSLFSGGLDLDPMRFSGMSEYIALQKAGGKNPHWQPELSSWDEFSRVDVVEYLGGPAVSKHIFINGRTPANMVGFSGKPEEMSYLRYMPGYVAFVSGKTDSACCIGAGGGVDVFVSLLGGAKHIDAVEINPGVVAATLKDGVFNGNVFAFDSVNLYVEDGRSFLARHPDKRYDVVYLALVQSITGDFNDLAFVEDYLYTVEAAGSYYEHLAEGGRVVMETHHERLLYRYAATLASMLADKGVGKDEILNHIGVFSFPKGEQHTSYVTLLFQTPPNAAQVSAVDEYVRIIGGQVLNLAGIVEDPILSHFVHGNGMLVIDDVDISPCKDDRPFFFRHSPQFVTMMLQIWAGVLLANLLLIALLWRGRRRLPTDGQTRGLGMLIAYFMLIGVNYTLVQIVVMQKSILFLGYPTLSLSVVLFTMLLGSGIGSYVSNRFASTLMGRARAVLLAVTVLGLAYAYGMAPLYRMLIGETIGIKMLTVVVLLLPISFLLGMPMPLGLRAAEKRFGEGIPYFWGLNGTASVLGSVTATVIALSRGFTAAWLVAVLITMILVLLLQRRAVDVDAE